MTPEREALLRAAIADCRKRYAGALRRLGES